MPVTERRSSPSPPTACRGPRSTGRAVPACRRSASAAPMRTSSSSRPRPRNRLRAQPEPAISTLVVSGKTPARIGADGRRCWRTGWTARVPMWRWPMSPTPSITTGPVHAASRRCARVTAPRRWPDCGRWPRANPRPAWWTPTRGLHGSGTVFVYSGQGSQWAGMGRQLLADEPAFAAAVAELEPDFVAQVGFFAARGAGWPVSRWWGSSGFSRCWSGMQLALTALWRSYGVEPDAVIGHSMGEVTAAVVSGALTPAEGLKVIATRSRLMSRLSGQGAMALLELDAEADRSWSSPTTPMSRWRCTPRRSRR